MQVITIAAAVMLNVSAQLAAKKSADYLMARGGSVAGWANPWLVVAIVCYAFAFLLTVQALTTERLTWVGPLMAGSTFVLVVICGVYLLGETVDTAQIGGIVLILGGIVLLSFSRR